MALSKFVATTSRSYFSMTVLLYTDNFQVMTVLGNVSPVPLYAALN